MPRVSVIIPTYNRARFLGEAAASVLAQTYRDYEVIIIDDGSTDNTPEVVSQFPPVVKYFRQENRGVSAARNRGIEMTSGEFLAFLDSDDILIEDALQKNVLFLDQHPEAGFCYGQVYKIDEDGRLLRLKSRRGARNTCVRDSREQIARLLFRGDIAVDTVMVRRSCFQEVGLFNTNLRVGEDIDMWLRISKRYSVGYLAEPLGKVRIHPENATNQGKFESLEKSQTAFVQRALEGVEFGPNGSHVRKKAYFGLYCYLSEEAARKGNRAAGFRYMMKALKTYPEMLFQWDGVSFLLAVARGFVPRGLLILSKQTLTTLRLR
jgi:glycosyltransferase involved in cell wall biosynthesis